MYEELEAYVIYGHNESIWGRMDYDTFKEKKAQLEKAGWELHLCDSYQDEDYGYRVNFFELTLKDEESALAAYLVIPGRNRAYPVSVPNNIDAWRLCMGRRCQLVDIPTRYLGTVAYDIVVDDEGLINTDDPIPGATDREFEPMLAGNLLIFRPVMGEEGPECGSLTEGDVEYIGKHIISAMWGNPDDKDHLPIKLLYGLSYSPEDGEDDDEEEVE